MNTITLNLNNGQEISAPIGIWLAALLATLPEHQQTGVKERVAQMMEKPHLVASHNHVLKAEPLNIQMKVIGDKGNGILQ